MTSPDEDTSTDSVLDKAKEQYETIGSRGNIRFGLLRAVFREGVVRTLGLLGSDGPAVVEPFGRGRGGRSSACLPRVGGADSALAIIGGLPLNSEVLWACSMLLDGLCGFGGIV